MSDVLFQDSPRAAKSRLLSGIPEGGGNQTCSEKQLHVRIVFA